METYNRANEDLGNVVGLEHINVAIPDQQLATWFYITGLGLTRDPYMLTGTSNMWINIGRSQFHLPTGEPQLLRGHVGLIIPDRAALLRRLAEVREPLSGTRFGFRENELYVEATSPWGNRLRLYEPREEFGRVTLGVPYIQFDVPPKSADGIARFYHQILGAWAAAEEDAEGRFARVSVGLNQHLIFRESNRPIPPYDGHHIQIYIADFSGPYRRLLQVGAVSEESGEHQYRFKDIIDLETGKLLFEIEHEVRSMRHPLYGRPLVNRNPTQTVVHYAPGQDAWNWQMVRADEQ